MEAEGIETNNREIFIFRIEKYQNNRVTVKIEPKIHLPKRGKIKGYRYLVLEGDDVYRVCIGMKEDVDLNVGDKYKASRKLLRTVAEEIIEYRNEKRAGSIEDEINPEEIELPDFDSDSDESELS